MRKIRDILRQKLDLGCSNRAIAASCKVSMTTVGECLRRAEKSGLSWPLPDDYDDDKLEATLYSGVYDVNTKITASVDPNLPST